MTIPAFARPLAAALAALATLVAAAPARANHSDVVISQVYGGGGNVGSTLRNDFIEIFNRGSADVDITGWSVQYASSAGSSWQRTTLTGILAPGQYYLIQEAAQGGGTQSLPTPDASGAIPMSATSGKVALVLPMPAGQTLLTCGGSGNSCIGHPLIRDFVGYGSAATNFEGTGPTATLAAATAAKRRGNGCTDADSNSADFTVVAGTAADPIVPRNTSSPRSLCSGPTPPRGTASATPASVPAGGSAVLTVAVVPGANPPSTGITVSANLTSIGGPNPAAMFDDGNAPDAAPNDGIFTLGVTVAPSTPSGPRTLTFAIADAQLRSSSATTTLTVQAVFRSIAQIQGAGARSPYDGQAVTTRGIVTARKTNGFFLQTADAEADSDAATSNAIFVFTGAAPPAVAAVGNEVTVSATVQEFVPSADPVQPPMTELSSAPAVSLVSTGNAPPLPVEMAPSADIDGQPFEHLEGMRVHVTSLTVVAPTDGNVSEPNASSTTTGVFYGVLTGVARPFREPGIAVLDPLPAGAPPNIPRFDENTERIRVDSRGQVGAAAVEVSTGAELTDFTGVVDYGFRTYTVLPDPATMESVIGAAAPVRAPLADEFTVGAFNLERFFDTANDPAIGEPVLTDDAFERRLRKTSLAIRNVMRSPDILGIEEAENLSVLQALAARVNADAVAAGDPDPGYVARLVEGNDVGGIDVGFLVRAPRVQIVFVEQVGKDATYINPLTSLPEMLNDRPPLVLRAAIPGPGAASFPVTVVVNHLRSLLGMDEVPGGARVRAKRVAQAEFLARLVDDLQHEAARAAVVAVGDFNAFEMSDGYVDVMGIVKGQPAPEDEVVTPGSDRIDPNLVNLVETIDPAAGQRYSYVFDGNAQVLDHVLITESLFPKLRGFEYARNDADFPESLRNDATRPERISDHDMPVAYFRLPQADVTVAKSASPAVAGGTVTYTLALANAGPDAAEAVSVEDALPAQLTFESAAAPSGWSCATPAVGAGGTVSCSTGEMASAAQVRIAARVGCAVPDGTPIANSATVSSTWDPVSANNTSAATVIVSNPPPGVGGASVDRSVLWPPNHQMVDVAVSYTVSDNCDPTPSCTLSVTSNEPQNGTGDGDTGPDWQVVDAHKVKLRAERAGSGSGRVYSIAISCADSAGHVGTAVTTVSVPRSR